MHSSVIVHKTFNWKRSSEETEIDIDEGDDTVSIINHNLNSPLSISVLTFTESDHGNYQFTCVATLQFSGEEDDISESDTANATVKGTV